MEKVRKRASAALSVLLLACGVTSAQAQVIRRKDAPIQAPPASEPPVTRQELPDVQAPTPAGSQEGIIVAPGGAKDIAIQFFSNVQTQVERNESVSFSFETAEPTEFFIEVSKERPNRNTPVKVPPGQKLEAAFPPYTKLVAFTLPGASGVKTQHQVTLRPALRELLESDTTYHYVITAKAPDGTFWRYEGKFTTFTHLVKVVFERVKIVNDGDPDPPPPLPPDCGEIDLWFWANYGQPSAQFLMIKNLTRGAPVKACTDHVYDINRRLVIENAPNVLSLAVSGHDNDKDDYAGSDLFEPSEPAPVARPHDSGDGEQNVATGEFDLRLFGAGATMPFTLVSKPASGGSQGDLMFEVYGHITITYPEP